jgi:spore coat polysaccharide biosynthesis protein SpsF
MSTSRTAIVLQARFASQRLPGKALALVGGRPLLEQCLRRLIAARAAPVILATTDRPEDTPLADIALWLGAGIVRGSSEDVLGRFCRCVTEQRLVHVVRATADNPGVDVDAPARVLAALQATGADYVEEEGLPYGAAVEGVTGDALLRAALLAADAYDREHVTTFVRKRSDLFRIVRLPAPRAVARADVRLTVDTAADLEQMRALYGATTSVMPSVGELIAAWDRTERRSVA